MLLDNKDHGIINELKQNSRISIRDIAKKLRLRPSTVHQRLRKLKTDGIIEKFTLKLNNSAMGENFIVFLLISGKPTGYIEANTLKNIHVKEAFGITGQYDLILKLKFKDIESFNDYIIKFRKEQTFVKETLSMVVTANLKEEI